MPGTGFIGRHLVVYLVENKLASLIRVCDKVRLIVICEYYYILCNA
jgi:hypothetical protein